MTVIAAVAVAILTTAISAVAVTTPSEPHARAAAVGTPTLVSPDNGVNLDAAPAFRWKTVRRAAKYEFQLSADSRFRSVVDRGEFLTKNTWATVPEALANGSYWWRVRAIDLKERAGKWSRVRSFQKAWNDRPELLGPENDARIVYPQNPLTLRWSQVPYAWKYQVTIATDPTLAQPVVTQRGEGVALDARGAPVETANTAFTPGVALAPGRYYWAVTPLDANENRGQRSAVGTFTWTWPSATQTRVTDLAADPRIDDMQVSWDPVPGAARYEVEINPSSDFAVGSRVCCNDPTTGNSLTSLKQLPNNNYHWRVRAFDLDDNAGQWNYGPDFHKGFDEVTPSIPNLRVRDHLGDLGPAPTTNSPVLAWDPVTGAAGYDVQVVPHTVVGCDWNANSSDSWLVPTATTAWTPLTSSNGAKPVPWSGNLARESRAFVAGKSYCARVRARADRDTQSHEVVSDWTTLGSFSTPAFHYTSTPPPDCTSTPSPSDPLVFPAACYNGPIGGVSPRMPLFTWRPIPGAQSYFVVVARDPLFTDIVDEAITRIPAYAPRHASSMKTYADETTSYYWAVMPAANPDGSGMPTTPQQDSPQAFEKRSVPPTLIGPNGGEDVWTQPTFRWTTTESVKTYRLQVSQDPTFGDPIDDIQTVSTAYTSSNTYPADTVLYWRVRATDGADIGLTWSAVGTFRRRLPAPTLNPFDPPSSQIPPTMAWSPVQGATSYSVHLEQPDGTQKDFDYFRTSAATFVRFYGTGVWRVSVRANFPQQRGGRQTPGPYSQVQAFTRYINPPPNARGVLSGRSALVSWDPSPVAPRYRVQIAATNSFTSPIESEDTDNTSFAPELTHSGYSSGKTLYWRVGVIDEGSNVGAWTTGVLRKARPLRVKVKGSARMAKPSRAVVLVRDKQGRKVRGAAVTIEGGGAYAARKRTGKSGRVAISFTPREKGKVTFRAAKTGYSPGAASLRVR